MTRNKSGAGKGDRLPKHATSKPTAAVARNDGANALRLRSWKLKPRIAVLAAIAAIAMGADFSRWLQLLWVDAQKQGVSSVRFDEALTGVQLDLSLPDLALPGRRPKEQAEFIKLPAAYLPEAQLSRLAHAGRRHLTTYKTTLSAIEAKYGVPGNIVIAVWGRETDHSSASRYVVC